MFDIKAIEAARDRITARGFVETVELYGFENDALDEAAQRYARAPSSVPSTRQQREAAAFSAGVLLGLELMELVVDVADN